MFLANENFPRPSVSLLRAKGFLVRSIQEECPGITDLEVVKVALKDSLVILTFDRDYGEIVFRYGKEQKPSVIFFRDKGADPEFAGNLLLELLLSTQLKFENAFSVVEHTNVRQRFY
jgi:predicted nuclease of predicted toxin-antitoxin system